ncbi:MAG: RNA 2',3'-cyclic phosphodiesterase [Eubacteriales bacterium]
MRQMRLFIAVNLPDPIKKTLAIIQKELKIVPTDAKWVEEENIHLTVKFLGNAGEGQVSGIVSAMRNAVRGFDPFDIDLAGAGIFPGIKNPRVLWVGLTGDVAALSLLQKRVEDSLSPLGFPPENGRFLPHLTMARLRSPRGAGLLLERAAAVVGKDKIAGFKVSSVELMQSELERSGPKYYRLAGVSLTG